MTLASPPPPAAESDDQVERFAEWAEENGVEGAAELKKEIQPAPPRARPLSEDGTLHEWRVRRKGTNPQRLLSRQPQPEEQLPV